MADTLNCQKETAEAIIKGKGNYLLNVKGNQAALEHESRDYVQDESLQKTMNCKAIIEKSRDRIETRTAYTTGVSYREFYDTYGARILSSAGVKSRTVTGKLTFTFTAKFL